MKEAATGDRGKVLDIFLFPTTTEFEYRVRHTDHTSLSTMRGIRPASLGAFMTLAMLRHAVTFLYL